MSHLPQKEKLVDILNCSISSLLLKYLGFPLGALLNQKLFGMVVEKMIKKKKKKKKKGRLDGGSFTCLRGGRLILIESTLSSLHTYFFFLFPLPVGIARRLECLHRDFLWDGSGRESKFHLVKWKTICSPVLGGGLGVKNIMLFNKALLGK
jgi:hypothetical protein